jgi:CubicO group peptidase (beta-lactamase class C family)
MIKYTLIIFTFFISSIGICQINFTSISNNVATKIDSFPNGFYISIALIKGDETHYLGLKKEDDSIITTDIKDSLFEIGSLTKVFTSTLLAEMVIQKELSLTDNINKTFSFKFHDKIKLNYISLSNHTSGLYRIPSNLFPLMFKNPSNPYKEYSVKLFNYYLEHELKLESESSTKYSYSNLGAGLLAHSISLNKRITFENMLFDNIFSKFKMTSTSFNLTPSFKGVKHNGTFAENWQLNALKGAGGLVSSTKDLSEFIQAQFNPKNTELNLTRISTHSISKNMSIGLGWHIIEPKSTNKKYWHNGGTGGFTSSIAFRTSNNTGIIVLSNISAQSSHSKVIDEICFYLLDSLN